MVWYSLRIVISDGRTIEGEFACTDQTSNIVLRQAEETAAPTATTTTSSDTQSTATAGVEERKFLGSVIVPGSHIKSIHLLDRK